MWPAEGSGFEADPYSPAGTAQRYWWLIQRRRPPSASEPRWITLALAIVLLAIAVGVIVFAVSNLA
jgi:uncharacterized membrane protein